MKTASLLLAVVLLACHVSTLNAVGDVAGENDSFPGWLGASFTVNSKKAPASKGTIDMSKVVQLSAWKPRAYLYKGFLSEEECDHIIQKARPRLIRSAVANNDNGKSELSEIRTSSGMFINKGEDTVIKTIEERISEWTFLPIPNQEHLQVLKYTRGQKYEPHVDYFHDPLNTQRGGHRYATVLMYLNTVQKGGETVFPNAPDPTPKDDTWSDCAKGYLAVKPQKGDALLFFSMFPDGSPDDSSLHYACPVIEGVKWSAPMWIHVADFNSVYKSNADTAVATVDDGSGCSDTVALCKTWAAKGECKKNARYMLQACQKSCNSC